MGSNPIPSIVVMGCNINFLNLRESTDVKEQMLTKYTIDHLENIDSIPLNIEKFDKDIEHIITGALPYYKSILKQMYFSNQQNANILYSFC